MTQALRKQKRKYGYRATQVQYMKLPKLFSIIGLRWGLGGIEYFPSQKLRGWNRTVIYHPRVRVEGQGIWQRIEGKEEQVLRDAQEAFRQTIRSVHPDVSTEADPAILVILAWKRIVHLFRNHGIEL